MISFPWDSVVEGFDEDTGFPLYDRSYTAEQLRDVLMTFFSNGIFADVPEAFVPKASQGMEITLSAGRCFIQGDVGVEKSVRTLELSPATSQPRYDTVVLRWDNNLEARSIDLYVKQGVASDKPVRPTLTRVETVWELGLCDIYIPANTTSVTQSRITDTRLDTARCGIVNPFNEIDTTRFYDQLMEATDKAVAAMERALDGTTAGHLQSQIDDIDDYTTGINLLRGTRSFSEYKGVTSYPNDANIYLDGFNFEDGSKGSIDTDEDGFTYFMMKGSSSQALQVKSSSVGNKLGDEFTLSFDLMFENVVDLYSPLFGIYYDSTTKGFTADTISFSGLEVEKNIQPKEWYRAKYTFKSKYDYEYIAVAFYAGENPVNIKGIKLERGDINRPLWSDSPFDLITMNGGRLYGNLTLRNTQPGINLAVDDTTRNFIYTAPAGSFVVYNGIKGGSIFSIDSNGVPTFVSPVPVSGGGTGGNTAINARENLKVYRIIGRDVTGGSKNDTAAFWTNQESGIYYFESPNMLVGQPSQFGFLENIKTGTVSSVGIQRFTTSGGKEYTRRLNGSSLNEFVPTVQENYLFYDVRNKTPSDSIITLAPSAIRSVQFRMKEDYGIDWFNPMSLSQFELTVQSGSAETNPAYVGIHRAIFGTNVVTLMLTNTSSKTISFTMRVGFKGVANSLMQPAT